MSFTKQDYYWIGGGCIAAAIGGFLWWKNSQNNKDQAQVTDGSGFDIPTDEPKTPKSSTPKITTSGGRNTYEPTEPTSVPKDTFRYQKGQMIMAAKGLLQTYEAKQNADGSFSAKLDKNGKSIPVAKIQPGDKLGEILFAGITDTGHVRYAVRRRGNFQNTYHWILGNSKIAPIEPKLVTVRLFDNKKLNLTRVLSKGLFDNPEVEELQRLLGFEKPDGDFGDITEKALFAKRGVKSISLAKF